MYSFSELARFTGMSEIFKRATALRNLPYKEREAQFPSLQHEADATLQSALIECRCPESQQLEAQRTLRYWLHMTADVFAPLDALEKRSK